MKRPPTAALNAAEVPPALEGSFWSYVQIDWATGCWLWKGYDASNCGYGRFKINYRRHAAHRVAYALAWGHVPSERLVRHTCDNRLCVAPHHLMLGSNADNSADMVARGRNAYGERAGTAVLTEDQVRAIKKDKLVTSRRLAEQYGVSRHTIGKIRQGLNWRHVV